MDIGSHILNLLKTLAGDPVARVHTLAVATAATVVIAIIRDAWGLRSEVNNPAPARITPPRVRDIRRTLR